MLGDIGRAFLRETLGRDLHEVNVKIYLFWTHSKYQHLIAIRNSV